jgi:heptosyltransferase II
MKKIAVIMPNWIGDFVIALSVVLRKAAEKDVSITLLVPDHLLTLSKNLSSLPLIPYHRKKSKVDFLKSIVEVRNGEFSKLYVLPHSFSSAWFAFRTGVPLRRGIVAEQRNPFLTEKVAKKIGTRESHLSMEYATILEVPYVPPDEWPGVQLNLHSEYKESIILCPGATYGPAKQWGGFNSLVKLLRNHEFVILGNHKDAEAAKDIAPYLPHRVRNLTGKTKIDEAISIIANGSLVISNDSGLMHLAGFLGTPVVGIFGSTTPLWTRPLGKQVRIASTPCSCSPCFKRTCPKKHYQCLRKIHPEKIVTLARELTNIH